MANLKCRCGKKLVGKQIKFCSKKCSRKQYYQEHKEEMKQYQKQNYQKHKEEKRKYDKKYYQEHKGKKSEMKLSHI